MQAQVVMALQGNAQFLPELFRRLKSAGPGDPEWLDQVAFLQELCSLAKHLQAASRTQLLSKLIGLGLFEVLLPPPASVGMACRDAAVLKSVGSTLQLDIMPAPEGRLKAETV